MVLSVGWKFGNMILLAWDQSMYSVESAFAQNSRSASSSLNVGIFFRGFIGSPLPRIHVASRYRTDQVTAYGEPDEQPASPVGLTESVVSGLVTGMSSIETKRDRLVEEDFFDLPIRNSMLRPVLADVSIVPVASFPG